MNATDFSVKNITVVAVQPTTSGSEIWAQDDDGREASYLVNDHSFRAREGHKMTAVLYGRHHAVALRNDSTMTKIKLLDGEDLLGSAPVVEPKSTTFWLCCFFFVTCGGMTFVGIIGMFIQHFLGEAVGNFVSIVTLLGLAFGVPYAGIIHPRIRRFRHNRRIKAADAVIAEIFKSL